MTYRTLAKHGVLAMIVVCPWYHHLACERKLVAAYAEEEQEEQA